MVDVEALSKLIGERRFDLGTARLAMMGAAVAAVRGFDLSALGRATTGAAIAAALQSIGNRSLTAQDVAPRVYVPEHLAIAPTIAAPPNPFNSVDPWKSLTS